MPEVPRILQMHLKRRARVRVPFELATVTGGTLVRFRFDATLVKVTEDWEFDPPGFVFHFEGEGLPERCKVPAGDRPPWLRLKDVFEVDVSIEMRPEEMPDSGGDGIRG